MTGGRGELTGGGGGLVGEPVLRSAFINFEIDAANGHVASVSYADPSS